MFKPIPENRDFVDPAGLGGDFDTTPMTESKATVPLARLLGGPVQTDFIKTILDRLNLAAGRAPIVLLDGDLRLWWLFPPASNQGCGLRDSYGQAEFADSDERPETNGETRLRGARLTMQRGKVRRDGQVSAAIILKQQACVATQTCAVAGHSIVNPNSVI